jgi:predicted nucleic acid-binding protein
MKNCIDSNILIYAFDKNSNYREKSKKLLSDFTDNGKIFICDISLIEFYQVITNNKKFIRSLLPEEAKNIIDEIINGDSFCVLYTTEEIIKQSFKNIPDYEIIRYNIYDHIIAMNLKNNEISNFYTANEKDFKKYEFLNVINSFK